MKTHFYAPLSILVIWLLVFQTPIYARTSSVNANFLLSAGPNICPGEQIFFNNISFGATRFLWKINGAVFSEARDTSYTFWVPGTFDITLIASDSACSDSLTRQLIVASPPNTAYNIVPQTCPGDSDGLIDLTLSGGSPPFVIGWTTGDTTQDISGLDSGRYILTLRDSVGCVHRDTVRVPSLGRLNANFQVQILNAFVRVTDLTDTTAIQWEWDMGDGTQYSLQNPTHTYSANGQYNLCLRVTDQVGCKDSLCEIIPIVSTGLSGSWQAKPDVYFDPVSESLRIGFSEAVTRKGDLSVWDLHGRSVKEKAIRAGETGAELRLTGLPTGVYLVRVTFSEKEFGFKFIKPH